MNQLNRWGLACALVAASVCGCGNSNNTKPFMPTPSVSAVSPAMVFLGRTKDVQVSGYATMWTDSTTIDFGPGVTVNKISAASATGVIANITVANNAMTGPRDVTVTDGTNMEVFKGAFDVEPPVKVTLQGTLAQGSVAVLHIDNKDLENLFDTTSTGDGFFTPIVYTNVSIAAPAGTTVIVQSVTQFAVDATVTVDVDAAATTADLDLVSGPAMGGTQVHFPSPGVLKIAARTAMPLPTGMTTGMVASAFDSGLYTFTPAAGLQVIDLAVTATDPMGQPSAIILPKSGHFKDLVDVAASKTMVSNATDPFYVILWDNTGYSGYNFTIQHNETAATATTDTEPGNDTKAGAVKVTGLPGVAAGATLKSAADQDWFELDNVPAGKKIHVITYASDPNTDTAVDVFASDGTTSLGGPSDNNSQVDLSEDFTSTATTTAGTYYVAVTAGASFDATSKTYGIIIRLE